MNLEQLQKLVYKKDASNIKFGEVSKVYFPENENDLLNFIKEAISKNTDIVCRGAGTNLVGSVLPNNSIILDFSKMDKILDIDEKNMNVTLEPGVVIDNLNLFLSKYNLFFPVIPGSHTSAEIGGMISTNAAGMRSIKYGKMNNWINWIEIIDGNLQKQRIEGQKINDICGSEGILCAITKVNLKITKKENISNLKFIKFEDLNNLLEYFFRLEKDNLISLEYIDKLTSKFLNLEEAYYLLIESREKNIDEFSFIEDEKEKNNIWRLRDSCYPILSSNGYIKIEDPEIKFEKIKEFLEWAEKNNIPTFGHIGVGILHPHFKEDQEELINLMYEFVRSLDSKISGEHGIGIKKKKYLTQEEKNRFINLKKIYDPNKVFNRNNLI